MNPYSFRNQILSLACLPISPPRRCDHDETKLVRARTLHRSTTGAIGEFRDCTSRGKRYHGQLWVKRPDGAETARRFPLVTLEGTRLRFPQDPDDRLFTKSALLHSFCSLSFSRTLLFSRPIFRGQVTRFSFLSIRTAVGLTCGVHAASDGWA